MPLPIEKSTKSKSGTSERDKSGHDELRLRTIPIDRIVIGDNHRSHDADAINDMAVSIREVGVINPVLVQYAGKIRRQSWFRKSAQGDKWSFCLTAGTLCPANQERQ